MKRRIKKRKKLKWKNLIILIFLFIFLFIFLYSSFNLIIISINNIKINKQFEKIKNISNIKKSKDNKNTKIIKQTAKPEDPYWDFIKLDLINIDLKELKKKNNDVKGWLKVNGTNINYPFVQSNDNEYYLNHSFDKSYNKAGWVFLDYRNNFSQNQKNTIIYAHGRVNKTMFGSLKDTLKKQWLEDKNNHVINTSTENKNALWQVFSVYKIPTTSDYLQIDFKSSDDFINFEKKLKERSVYDFKTSLQKEDRILTLSTCYNSKEKVVLHAKLIKEELK